MPFLPGAASFLAAFGFRAQVSCADSEEWVREVGMWCSYRMLPFLIWRIFNKEAFLYRLVLENSRMRNWNSPSPSRRHGLGHRLKPVTMAFEGVALIPPPWCRVPTFGELLLSVFEAPASAWRKPASALERTASEASQSLGSSVLADLAGERER